MNIESENLPKPMTTIDDLLEEGDSTEKPYKVFVGNNLGYRTYIMHVPMHEFFEMSEVANDPGRDADSIAQRKLDPAHAQKLGVYILKGLVTGAIQSRIEKKQEPSPTLERILSNIGRQPYQALQPIVVNIRTCDPFGRNIRATRLETKTNVTAAFEVYLSQRHVLWVIDGQHRRMGMKNVFEFLDVIRKTGQYPKKSPLYVSDTSEITPVELQAWEEVYAAARTFCRVALEVHLGLNTAQERQLFHDLNNLGKRVDKNLALKFDSSNPVNLFIKEVLHEELGMNIVERELKDWKDDVGEISWKDLVAVNAILFMNKTNIGGALPQDVTQKTALAKRFWEAVNAIPGFGEERAKEKTVSAQPVVLKALAKLTFDYAFSNRKGPHADYCLETLLNGLSEIDFSHENPMWRYYEYNQETIVSNGLESLTDYLPADDGSNRDIGSYQSGFMRFGAKHNDIYPIIGDMIRWKLKLPKRGDKTFNLSVDDI